MYFMLTGRSDCKYLGEGGLIISDSIRYFGRGDYVGILGEQLSNVTKLCHNIPDFTS